MTQGTVQAAVLNNLADEINATACEKGFWQLPDDHLSLINTKLLLIVSEAIEAMDVIRKTAPDEVVRGDFIEELADIIIRTFDLAEYIGAGEIGDIILRKMDTNASRPFKHGRTF